LFFKKTFGGIQKIYFLIVRFSSTFADIKKEGTIVADKTEALFKF